MGNSIGGSAIPPYAVQRMPRKALAEISRRRPEIADIARDLSREARRFMRLDRTKGAKDLWFFAYEATLNTAEHFFYGLGKPRTSSERVLFDWARRVAPHRADVARRAWLPVSGLSPRYLYLQVLLNAALLHWARASMLYDRLPVRGSYMDYLATGIVGAACSRASGRVHAIAYEIIWRAGASSDADRFLMRRAVELWCYEDRLFNRKFRQAIIDLERERGGGWVEAFETRTIHKGLVEFGRGEAKRIDEAPRPRLTVRYLRCD